jgi:hypothetical protein
MDHWIEVEVRMPMNSTIDGLEIKEQNSDHITSTCKES